MVKTIECPQCGAVCKLPSIVVAYAKDNTTSLGVKIPTSSGYYCECCKKHYVTSEMTLEILKEVENNSGDCMEWVEYEDGRICVIYHEDYFDRDKTVEIISEGEF